MKKLAIGVFGTFIAFALMAPTGGFPSRPVFNAVAIGPGTAVGAAGTLTTSNSVTIGGNLSIPTGVARLSCSGVLSDPLTVCSSSDHTTKWLTVSTTSGGVLAGAPTGGDKGIGTLNATAVYSAGVQLLPSVNAIITSPTTRTSTIALSCDAQLIVTAPTNSKTYAVRAVFGYDQELSTTQGISFTIGATGTGTVLGGTAIAGSNGAVPLGGQGPVSIDPSNTLHSVAWTSASGALIQSGVADAIVTTGAGAATFCLSWAQNVSNATPTRIDYGYITLTQLN